MRGILYLRILCSLFAGTGLIAGVEDPDEKTLASATLAAALLFASCPRLPPPHRCACAASRLPCRHHRLQLFGDIWTASDDGSRTRRLTVPPRPRCLSSASLPTDGWSRSRRIDTAASTLRGAVGGWNPQALDLPFRTDDVVGWTATRRT